MKKIMKFILVFAITLMAVSCLAGDVKMESDLAEQIYYLYANDQFVDPMIAVMNKRDQGFFNTFLIKAFQKYKSRNYKKAFTDKLIATFSEEELKSLKTFYEHRQKVFEETIPTAVLPKFYEFNTDLQFLLAEVKDDDEEESPKEVVESARDELAFVRYKACSANMLVLKAAIEMYNMDFEPKITKLSPKDYQARGALIEKKVLFSEISLPDEQCDYYIYGDVLKDSNWEVRCKFHGEKLSTPKETH